MKECSKFILVVKTFFFDNISLLRSLSPFKEKNLDKAITGNYLMVT